MLPAGDIDPRVWKACAGGAAAQIPPVGSRVYYFPEGHAEQASADPDLAPLGAPPYFTCRVAEVRHLADRDSDEVYARIKLAPEPPPSAPSSQLSNHNPPHPSPPPLPSFAKVLTASDANNGGGFSVPRFCAETVFPPLDYADDPPLQNVVFRDVHGVIWEFRHIYRGTPRRHLLTTGWSKFVNAKKLIAGDSVVFIQKNPGDLYVGIQRVVKHQPPMQTHSTTVDYSGIVSPKGNNHNSSGSSFNNNTGRDDHRNNQPRAASGFSRTWRGRVPPENVVQAVRAAQEGRTFEVMHYPKPGTPDFVVRGDLVEAAMTPYWAAGIRVKMAVEADDSSPAAPRTTWHQGTITSTGFGDAHRGGSTPSIWRMLQVSWDEPDLLHPKSINPWQVEITSVAPQIPPSYPSAKRFKPMSPDLPTHSEQTMFFPIPGIPDAVTVSVNPAVFRYNPFPAGMQGARQDTIAVSTLSTHGAATPQVLSDYSLTIVPPQNLNSLSTEPNFLTSSQSESSSPPSRNSVLSLDKEPYRKTIANSPKTNNFSFQLFGVLISLKEDQPADSATAVNKVGEEQAAGEDPPQISPSL